VPLRGISVPARCENDFANHDFVIRSPLKNCRMQKIDHLIVFSRFPVPGEAKTRLIPALGADGAAELQCQMTEHTVAQARKTGAQIEIRRTGGTEEQMRGWLGDDLDYAGQGGGDLGDRMARAFQEHFAAGAERVVIVGCDCPSNGWKNIQKSFQALEKTDCVIGPASDGGYYLIGFCRAGSATPPPRSRTSATFSTEMFQNIDWGTERVLEQTLAVAFGLSVETHPGLRPPLQGRGGFKIPSMGGVPERRGGFSHWFRTDSSVTKGLALTLLPELDDVDLPDDIPPKISVIIPTLNEAATILPTLGKVKEGFNAEVIVVDGGSTDGTEQIVESSSAHFVKCAKGRAVQQNVGAAAATGEILLFLHADTELPDNWDFIIRNALGSRQSSRIVGRESLCSLSRQEDTRSRIRDSTHGREASLLRGNDQRKWQPCPTINPRQFVALGAFQFGVKERLRGIGTVEWGTNIRSQVFRMPYGDQGLFLRRDTFETIGGFPDPPIMEDVALVKAARRVGKIVTVQETALTSARRWQKRGVVRTTLLNQLILLGAALGVSPQNLRRLYG
jgi:rSAM/selenodomain-associated transferase 1